MQGSPCISFLGGNMKKKPIFKLIALCLVFAFVFLSTPITSQAAFNKTTAKKHVSVSYKKLSNGVLAIYKNKNKENLSLKATFKFLDSDNSCLSKETQKNLCLKGKSTAAFFFAAPVDEYGNPINYSKYKGSYSVNKSKNKSYSTKIKVNAEVDVTETRFVALNSSAKKLSNIHATIVFYDGNNEIVACATKYLNCFERNSMDQFSINYAGAHYCPSKAKIYIDWAY